MGPTTGCVFLERLFFSSLLVLLGGVRVLWRQLSLVEDTRESVYGFRLLLGSSVRKEMQDIKPHFELLWILPSRFWLYKQSSQ
jgi:hypothetical protein